MLVSRSIQTIAVLALLSALRGHSQTYTITELPPLPGGDFSAGFGINDSGLVTGESFEIGSGPRAVVWIDGVAHSLQGPGITSSVGYAINQAGHVTGDSFPRINNSGAFLWRGASMEILAGTPDFFIIEAFDLNDFNQVVGTGGPTFGYLWQEGSLTALNRLPGDHTARPHSINNSGEIGGTSIGPSGRRPVVWTNNTPLPLSASIGEVYGINNNSEAVGYYRPDFIMRPFFWTRSGGFQPLPLPDGANSGFAWAINDRSEIIGNIDGRPALWRKDAGGFEVSYVDDLLPSGSGWSDLYLSGINNSGQITGEGFHFDEFRGFILTPVPVFEAFVDLNRDGVIAFDQADRTTPGRPFRFWLNDDRDSSGVEEDPSRGRPDNHDLIISHERDLEDFARLALRLPSDMKEKVSAGYRLVLETPGTIDINLFKAVEMANETDYLTDESAARRQVESPYNRALHPDVLVVSLEERHFAAGKALFLWEGTMPGVGVLRFRLIKPDGTDEAVSEVHVALRPVRDFFEHVRAVPAGGFDPPYETGGWTPPVSWETVHPQLVSNPSETPQCIVWVHGWRLPPWERQNWAEMMFKRLWHAGYSGRFAAFSWFTHDREAGPIAQFKTYNQSEHRAWKAGFALDDYLRNVRDRLPESHSLNLCAHSMGNVVAGEALRRGAPVENYVMMQAAVSASCYDERSELFVADFLAAEQQTPTPDETSRFGYRGYLAGVQANVVNFYNELDYALRTGKLGGLKEANWTANNKSDKPVKLRGRDQYAFFNEIPGIYTLRGRKTPRVLIRRLTDPHESMAFLARSRTHAAGAEQRVGFDQDNQPFGAIGGRIDLADRFGFTDERPEHSAQFNRPIQRQMVPFYLQLLESLGIQPPQ